MKVYYNYWSVVIEDLEGISLAEIRKFYQEFLLKIRFLMPGDVVDRCVKDGRYHLINGHGGLRDDRLYKFILTLFDSFGLKYDDCGVLSNDLEKQLTIHFPVRIAPNEYTGGSPGLVNETSNLSIDLGIKPLCDVINSIDGLTSQASCEGHGFVNIDECSAYMTFTSDNNDNLSKLTTAIKRSENQLHEKYSMIFWQNHFLSNLQDELIYKFTITYKFRHQEKAFEYIHLMSTLIYDNFRK